MKILRNIVSICVNTGIMKRLMYPMVSYTTLSSSNKKIITCNKSFQCKFIKTNEQQK